MKLAILSDLESRFCTVGSPINVQSCNGFRKQFVIGEYEYVTGSSKQRVVVKTISSLTYFTEEII